jgi:hypothetical protein
VRRLPQFADAVRTTEGAEHLAAAAGNPLQDLQRVLFCVDRSLVPEQKHFGVLLDQGWARLNAATGKLAKGILSSSMSRVDRSASSPQLDRRSPRPR